jgi:hypothetical protein
MINCLNKCTAAVGRIVFENCRYVEYFRGIFLKKGYVLNTG